MEQLASPSPDPRPASITVSPIDRQLPSTPERCSVCSRKGRPVPRSRAMELFATYTVSPSPSCLLLSLRLCGCGAQAPGSRHVEREGRRRGGASMAHGEAGRGRGDGEGFRDARPPLDQSWIRGWMGWWAFCFVEDRLPL
ncbi:hypothetical protein G7046_g4527 [Stylonectria norvegica]|nr:hypothetical protein G7046_g4527 [Stylonectria norvegica]